MDTAQALEHNRQETDLKRVFIVGVPRSGTTWMLSLLAQHPSIVASQGSGFFQALKLLENWWYTGAHYSKSVFASSQNKAASSSDEDINFEKTGLVALLSSEEFFDLSRPLAHHVFDKVANYRSGTQVVVEQTPEDILLIDLILKVLPDAYILHVIRDPRSVFASMRAAVLSWADPRGFPSSPADVGNLWRSSIENGRRMARATSRYKEIRYEDLLEHGPNVLDNLFEWLDLSSDLEFCQAAVEACTLENLRKRKGLGPKGFFRTGKAAGWHKELYKANLRIIEYTAGDLMEQLGYERSTKPPKHKPFQIWLREDVIPILKLIPQGSLSLIRKFVQAVPPARYLSRYIRSTAKTVERMFKKNIYLAPLGLQSPAPIFIIQAIPTHFHYVFHLHFITHAHFVLHFH